MPNELTANHPNASATLYAVVRRVSDARVWNGSSFVTWADADVNDYAVPLTPKGGDLFAANFPPTIAAGKYHVDYYRQSGDEPATDDVRLDGEKHSWNGNTTTAPDEVTAADMVVRIKAALATGNATITMTTVDGQSVQWDRKQALAELKFWQHEATREAGTRPRNLRVNLSRGFCD